MTQLRLAGRDQLPEPGQTTSSQSRMRSPPVFPLRDPSALAQACWFPRQARVTSQSPIRLSLCYIIFQHLSLCLEMVYVFSQPKTCLLCNFPLCTLNVKLEPSASLSLLSGPRKLPLLVGMVLRTRGHPGDLSRGGQHQAVPVSGGHHLHVRERGHGSPGWGGREEAISYEITIVLRREFFTHSENEREWQQGLVRR